MLQGSDPGWLGRLCRDYGLPAIELGDGDVLTLRTAEGTPLDDIRTEADNADAADAITETIRSLTTDPGSALHVSIAGARKTLGLFSPAMLCPLYGRAQDRLSHVLVSPPFESNQNFFSASGGSSLGRRPATVKLSRFNSFLILAQHRPGLAMWPAAKVSIPSPSGNSPARGTGSTGIAMSSCFNPFFIRE